MKVTCLHLELIEKQARLYVAEISTAEALKLFAASESLRVTELGASPFKGSGWTSVKDLPPIKTVGEIIKFLGTNDHLNLIDFTGTIGGKTELSTHDDGEATFRVDNEANAIDLLRRIIDADTFDVTSAALIANKGKYLFPVEGKIEVSDAFKGWDLTGR